MELERPSDHLVAEFLKRRHAVAERVPAVASDPSDILDDHGLGLDEPSDTSHSEEEIVSRVVMARVIVERRMPLARRAGKKQPVLRQPAEQIALFFPPSLRNRPKDAFEIGDRAGVRRANGPPQDL